MFQAQIPAPLKKSYIILPLEIVRCCFFFFIISSFSGFTKSGRSAKFTLAEWHMKGQMISFDAGFETLKR